MNVVTRGIRNAFRNQIRTFSIIVILGLSIGLALSMLVAHQAVGDKIDTVKSAVGNTVNISPAGVRGFDGGGAALTDDQLKKVAAIDHVTSVTKSLDDRLTTDNTNLQSAVEAGNLGQRNAQNNGTNFTAGPPAGGIGLERSESTDGTTITRSFTPPVMLVGTTAPSDLSSSRGGGTFTLKSGEVFSSTNTENVALIGTTLATKNNLKVGSTFTAYNTTVKVTGIFDAGNAFSNNQVIMPLAVVQRLSGQTNSITSATLLVDSVSNVDSVTKAASSTLGSAADVTNAAEQAKQSIQPLENIQTISLYSLAGAIVAGAVIILLTMVMIVRERRREIGVLKAIGASNTKVVGQFMTEAGTLTTLGAALGIVVGVLAASPITRMLVTNSTSTPTTMGLNRPGGGPRIMGVQDSLSAIDASVGWSIIVYGFVAALVIAFAGSALAAFFIAKVRPAEVMRAE